MGGKPRSKTIARPSSVVANQASLGVRSPLLDTPNPRVRAQRNFFNRLNEPFKRAVREHYRTHSVKNQRELKRLEREIRALMRAHPGHLPLASWKRAEKVLDEAYEVAGKFNPNAVWQTVYKTKAARRLVDKAVADGLVSFGGDPLWARKGLTPRVENEFGRRTRLNIDHWLPRERNPFKTFDPDNLFPVTRKSNEFRSEWSKNDRFPMENAPTRSMPDDIEAWSQKHSLSRRQRNPPPTDDGRRSPDSPTDRATRTPHNAADTPTAASRGTEARLDGTNTPPARAGLTPDLNRPNSANFTKAGKLRKALAVAGDILGVVDFDPLDMAMKPLRLGFVSGLLIGLAVELIFFVFERRLARENARGVAREYRSKVYQGIREERSGRTLEQLVAQTVELVQTDDGSFKGLDRKKLNDSYIYVDYRYDILMGVQDEDFEDAVIFVLRGLKLVEVYENLEPVGTLDQLVSSAPLKESEIFSQKRGHAGKDDTVRYHCHHRMLLWDPLIYQRYIDLWNWQMGCRNAMAKALKMQTGISRRLAEFHAKIVIDMVTEFRFHDAVAFLDGAHPLNEEFGKPAEPLRRSMREVRVNASQGDLVLENARKLQADRRTLLMMYAGQDVFGDRRAAQAAIRKHAAANDPTTFATSRFPGSRIIL